MLTALLVAVACGAAGVGAAWWWSGRHAETPSASAPTASVTEPWAESAHWAPRTLNQAALLALDADGSMLVSFHSPGVALDSRGTPFGEAPGVLLVGADDAVTTLVEPEGLGARDRADVVGALRGDRVALAFTVYEGTLNENGNVSVASDGATARLWWGSRAGVELAPGPTINGAPALIDWGGLWLTDDAAIANAFFASDAPFGDRYVGSLDPSTGELSPVLSGLTLGLFPDQCDADGNTFVVGWLPDATLEAHRIRVVDGVAGPPQRVDPLPGMGRMTPVSACGDDVVGNVFDAGTDGAVVWGNGATLLTYPFGGRVAGDTFLGPDDVTATVSIPVDGDGTSSVLVLDRTSAELLGEAPTCTRVLRVGEWLGFGYPMAGTCVPVAVPVEAFTASSSSGERDQAAVGVNLGDQAIRDERSEAAVQLARLHIR